MSGPEIQTTLRRMLGAGRPEVSCEQCFEALDRYVEAEVTGRDPNATVPGLAAHLEGCSACAGDHASLLAIVQAETNSRYRRTR